MIIDRRHFLAASTSAASSLLSSARAQPAPNTVRPQPSIPHWRGFNLPDLMGDSRQQHFQESDFHWMAQWGFNFARLPCSYLIWSNKLNWMSVDELALQPLDQAIQWGRQYKIHINLNLHHVPGYGSATERYQLFNSPHDSMLPALQATAYHWRYLAHRYKAVPSSQLSFNPINEAPFMTDQSRYVEIMRVLIESIRDVSPDRLIFADGTDLAQTPVMALADEGIVQSTRGYLPKMVSHYKAGWVAPGEFESLATPTWPMTDNHGVLWNRDKLRQELIVKWQPLVALGVPVHVGEFGCYHKTPHHVALAWMSDLFALWKEVGWGWALWNLRGSFGIVDSGRSDVAYELFDGHQLDRKMLELLLAN